MWYYYIFYIIFLNLTSWYNRITRNKITATGVETERRRSQQLSKWLVFVAHFKSWSFQPHQPFSALAVKCSLCLVLSQPCPIRAHYKAWRNAANVVQFLNFNLLMDFIIKRVVKMKPLKTDTITKITVHLLSRCE